LSVAANAEAVEFVFVDDELAMLVAHPNPTGVSLAARVPGDPRSIDVLAIDRDQIFRPGEDEYIRVPVVKVAGQAFVGLACN
jgi:hypothetical protein